MQYSKGVGLSKAHISLVFLDQILLFPTGENPVKWMGCIYQYFMIPVFTMVTACDFPPLSLIYVHPKIGWWVLYAPSLQRGKFDASSQAIKNKETKPDRTIIFSLLLWESSTLVNDFSVLFYHQEMALTKSVFMQRILFQPPFIGEINNKNPAEIGKFWKFCTWKILENCVEATCSSGWIRISLFWY